jgi:hypothetical protein
MAFREARDPTGFSEQPMTRKVARDRVMAQRGVNTAGSNQPVKLGASLRSGRVFEIAQPLFFILKLCLACMSGYGCWQTSLMTSHWL